MVTAVMQRQFFELACPQCSSADLAETPDGRLHCPGCHRTHSPGDCAVASVQTEIVEETEAEIVVLSGTVILAPGRAYEIATTPVRCPNCGELGIEVATNNVGACFACYSAVLVEDMVIDSRDTAQTWVRVSITHGGSPTVAVQGVG